MAKKSSDSDSGVDYWLKEIDAAKKREKDFRKTGREIVELYESQKRTPFNILFSNVETLLPALYSQVPRPVVKRRFDDADPMGKAASMAAQRMLEFIADTGGDGHDTLSEAITGAVMDALVPGRGVTTVSYDALWSPLADDSDPKTEDDDTEEVKAEGVYFSARRWDRVYFGQADKWSSMPWIAYEEYIDKVEAKRLFGRKASKLNYTTGENEEDDSPNRKQKEEGGGLKTAVVYQIWDKAGGRRLRYVSPDYKEGFLLDQPDPLGLSGFFNCPKPLRFIQTVNNLTPVAMYSVYENQARELNRITGRLNKIIDAMKVRGVYDSHFGTELQQLFDGDDNFLTPTDKAEALLEGGFDKAIWLMPLDKLVAVASFLAQAREQIKQVIYEITGISDILRGKSAASETLGAQKIKESWGSMRLKRLQQAVQVYARDLLRIALELAASKLSQKTWAAATLLPFSTQEQLEQAEALKNAHIQAYTQLTQQAAAFGQPPPPEPERDPRAVAILEAPAWPDVLNLLQDDVLRAYHVDIETNSTIDAEATEDQKIIGDFMNAMGQMMAGLTPMVESGAMPFEASQALLLAVVRRYRFGSEVEEHFKQMKAPEKGNPEAEKLQEQVQQLQQALATAQQNTEAQMAMQTERLGHEQALKAADHRARLEEAKLNAVAMLEKVDREIEAELVVKQFETEADGERSNLKAMLEEFIENHNALLDQMEA